jgi:BolA family transcriptional regulator, general stress-responsive regulator
MSISTKTRIETKIRGELNPSALSVVNESHMHNVPRDAETHFKVTVVTESFASMRLVQRHQLIYRILADELVSGVHALALHTYTTEEWQNKQASPDSPPCLG